MNREAEIRALNSELARRGPETKLTDDRINLIREALYTQIAEDRRFESLRGKQSPETRYGLDAL